MNKTAKVGIAIAGVGAFAIGGTATYASIFGEENITLAAQLTELIGIGENTYQMLHEAREGIDLARETVDEARRVRAAIDDLDHYTTDRFREDFKRDVMRTHPDLAYIIRETSADGLRDWRDSTVRSPMGSYELIGRVFGEATQELRQAQEEGRVKVESSVLYRYESAVTLAASANAESFIEKSDADIAEILEALEGASEGEAVVLGARLQALIAAQQSHILRLLSRSVRREGIEDARHYQGAVTAMEFGLGLSQKTKEDEAAIQRAKKSPRLMTFESPW